MYLDQERGAWSILCGWLGCALLFMVVILLQTGLGATGSCDERVEDEGLALVSQKFGVTLLWDMCKQVDLASPEEEIYQVVAVDSDYSTRSGELRINDGVVSLIFGDGEILNAHVSELPSAGSEGVASMIYVLDVIEDLDEFKRWSPWPVLLVGIAVFGVIARAAFRRGTRGLAALVVIGEIGLIVYAGVALAQPDPIERASLAAIERTYGVVQVREGDRLTKYGPFTESVRSDLYRDERGNLFEGVVLSIESHRLGNHVQLLVEESGDYRPYGERADVPGAGKDLPACWLHATCLRVGWFHE